MTIYEVHYDGMFNEVAVCTDDSGAALQWTTRDGAEAYIRREYGFGSRNERISAWVVETAGDLDLTGVDEERDDEERVL